MIYRIKEISWFKQKFLLDIPGPNDYSIEGSFWKHDYVFTRKNGVAATVNKGLNGFFRGGKSFYL